MFPRVFVCIQIGGKKDVPMLNWNNVPVYFSFMIDNFINPKRGSKFIFPHKQIYNKESQTVTTKETYKRHTNTTILALTH